MRLHKTVTDANQGNFLQTLSHEQFQQLLAMLSTHMTSNGRQNDSPSTSYVTGTCFSISVHPMLSSLYYWIPDSGASRHCFHARAFLFLKPIEDAKVTLPDRTLIPIYYCGDVQLNPYLTLTDVLYVP